jgi:class 3 adenylate cyclase/tetratricopeptide (TPR) repeat protein
MQEIDGYISLTQRRHLTVLFSDLSSSSEIAESMEAEELSLIFEYMRVCARDLIPRHGGRIARIQGDGLLAIFGYPHALEDDGRRACEAALDLHSAMKNIPDSYTPNPLSLKMHSGIHAGLVLVTEGDIERGRFDVVGEVPNTAARLCALAKADEICVSIETLGPQSHFFQHSAPQTVDLKGRAAPLTVTTVASRSAIDRRYEASAAGGLSKFVGRTNAMSALNVRMEQVLNGEPSALVVVGEPGIGKTRLLDEFQRQIDSERLNLLHGFCESYLSSEPMQPFLHIVRAGLGWSNGLPSEEFARIANIRLTELGGRMPDAMQPLVKFLVGKQFDSEKSSVAEVIPKLVCELVSELARRKPLLLVLDDWQWADDASRSILNTLLSLKLPMMVLIASRPVSVGDDVAYGVDVLHLRGFEPQECAAAVADLLPDAHPFLLQDIQTQSGGCPLFIEELCHSIAAGVTLQSSERKTSTAAWINSLVASRVNRLPKDEAKLLQFASVIGNAFPSQLLEQLTGHGEHSALVTELTSHDFLFASGHEGLLRFKHALTREAVYATVGLAERRSIHKQIAEHLRASRGLGEPHDWIEAVAYHCDSAGLVVEAAHYSEISGDKAMSALALDSARGHYVVALRALDRQHTLDLSKKMQWVNLAQKLGLACVFDPLDLPNGLLLFERAGQLARELGDHKLMARAEYCLAYMTHAKGKLLDAQKHSEAALALARQIEDARLVSNVMAILGQIHVATGSYQQAQQCISEAVELKTKNGISGERAAMAAAYFLAGKAFMLGDQGKFAQSHECFAESLNIMRDVNHPTGASIWTLRSAVYMWQGRWDEAIDAAKKGEKFALRARTHSLTATSRALAASATWATNKDEGSLRTLRASAQWIEDSGGAVSNSLNYGWLVQASVERGEDELARQYGAKLLRNSRQLDRHGVAMGRRGLARIAARNGDLVTARRHLEKANSNATTRDATHELASNLMIQAEIALRGHQRDAARGFIDDACERFERLSMLWHLEDAMKHITYYSLA